MSHDERSLLTMSRRECVARLRSAKVGRVVFTERALPAVLPVSYGVLREDVVIATRSGSRLEAAARGAVLAFEVDEIDPAMRTGWSVIVTGVPEVMTDPLLRAAAASVLDPWVPGHNDVLIRIPATVMTGRQVDASPGGLAGVG